MRRVYIICFLTTIVVVLAAAIYFIYTNTSQREKSETADYYLAVNSGDNIQNEAVISESSQPMETKVEPKKEKKLPDVLLSEAEVNNSNFHEEVASAKESMNQEIKDEIMHRQVKLKSRPEDYEYTGNFILYPIDDEIVIFYEDFVNIYDYTGIRLDSLPKEIAKEISYGKQMHTLEELYRFLENYSS